MKIRFTAKEVDYVRYLLELRYEATPDKPNREEKEQLKLADELYDRLSFIAANVSDD